MEQAWLLARMDEQGESSAVAPRRRWAFGDSWTCWDLAFGGVLRLVGEVVGVLSGTTQWLSLRSSVVNMLDFFTGKSYQGFGDEVFCRVKTEKEALLKEIFHET